MKSGIPDNGHVAMGFHDLFKGSIALQFQYPVGLLDIAHDPQYQLTADHRQAPLDNCHSLQRASAGRRKESSSAFQVLDFEFQPVRRL